MRLGFAIRKNHDQNLKDIFQDNMIYNPIYFENNIPGSIENIFVRETLIIMLFKAYTSLPSHLTFKIFDGYRPIEVQEYLFNNFFNILKNKYPNLNTNELKDINNPPLHNTGGSIDLTLVNKITNKELNMGTKFDDFSEKSNTSFFENTSEEEIKNNRRILYWTMINAGFTNLTSEWWHYDFGNISYAKITGSPIIYQGIKNI